MIKTLLLLFCFVTGSFCSMAQIRSTRDLLGTWQGKDLQLQFFADARVVVVMPGGKLPVATYTANFTTAPISIAITLMDHGQKMIYSGNMEFINNETIKLTYFGTDSDPNAAFDAGRTLTLKKQR